MYKPGTQLIMNELWAAAAAHKLGFNVVPHRGDGKPPHCSFCGDYHNEDFLEYVAIADWWEITVTESGPNAAERVQALVITLRKCATLMESLTKEPQFSKVI